MVCDKISFALKNTNWCNLKCAHCSERSGPDVAPNIMPLDKVEKYIAEFNAMPMPKWEYMVFTGGETMAHYFHNQVEYMSRCLDIAAQHKMAPFVKTNGVWGGNDAMRARILRDFAAAAYRNNILMSMDISVDAFHNNINSVFKILNDVVRSDCLAPAVRLSLCGFNDMKSHVAFMSVINALCASGLAVETPHNGMFVLSVPGVRGMDVYYDLWTNISNVGRAADNKLGCFVPDGRPDMSMGHCLQIDNNDVATLNYKHATPVNGRPVYDVARELLLKVR
jgi:hypothetical protein